VELPSPLWAVPSGKCSTLSPSSWEASWDQAKRRL
jgi:hypothetical protein